MAEEFEIDLNSLLQKCQLNDGLDSEVVISNITELEARYEQKQMTSIYSYFLKNCHDPEVLLYIVKQINKYRPLEALEILLDLLLLKQDFKDNLNETEKYVNLRVNTAKVISNYKENSAVMPLLYCLNNKDEHYKIRLACAEALGKIGDKYAVTPLIDVVSDESEKSVYLRESAAVALGMIGDMRAVDSLVHILEAKKTFLDKFTFLKERVIEALGKINTPNERVFKALKNSLDDESPQIRINAIEALMNSDDSRAVEMIKKALFDKNDEVVENAVIALYNLEDIDILNEIMESGEYPDYARIYAAKLKDECENGEDDDEE